MDDFFLLLTIFALAIFVGFEIITKVPPTLHTPLMSGSNAISGITVIGALILAGTTGSQLIGMFALIFAMVHELGHVLGLRHLCVNAQTLMDTSSCSHIGVVVNIHPEGASYFDALALKALYDPAVLPGDTLGDLRALGLVP